MVNNPCLLGDLPWGVFAFQSRQSYLILYDRRIQHICLVLNPSYVNMLLAPNLTTFLLPSSMCLFHWMAQHAHGRPFTRRNSSNQIKLSGLDLVFRLHLDRGIWTVGILTVIWMKSTFKKYPLWSPTETETMWAMPEKCSEIRRQLGGASGSQEWGFYAMMLPVPL